MKIAFFDTKPYDRQSFEKYQTDDLKFKFFETKLNLDTADLARGCDVVCIFVNDVANADILDRLYELGVKVLALRCAGYNNVDVKYKITDRRPGDIDACYADPSYAKEKLNWEAKLGIEEMCKDAYNFVRKFKEDD